MQHGEVERWVELAAGGDASSRTSLLDAFDATKDGGNVVLQLLAEEAARGSQECLELVITMLDRGRVSQGPIRSMIADDAAVQDIAQDTLIACASSIGTYRSESPFPGWVAGIARNQAKQYIRRNSRHVAREERAAVERPTERISSIIANREMVGNALSHLPETYREAVVLRDIEQLSYVEIADRLDIELNTVRSRISRGRALVAAAMIA